MDCFYNENKYNSHEFERAALDQEVNPSGSVIRYMSVTAGIPYLIAEIAAPTIVWSRIRHLEMPSSPPGSYCSCMMVSNDNRETL